MSPPVATTTAVALPLPTLVPRYATVRSSSGDDGAAPCSAANFSTGTLSPVSEPCTTNRSFACTMRTSPGIMSPAVSRTTSPGTSCETATSALAPPRIAVAFTEIMALSFAAAPLALASWKRRRPTLSAIIASIIVAARGSPVAKDTAARPASSTTNGLRSARPKSRSSDGGWSFARTLGPCVARRASTSAGVSPSGRDFMRA